MVAKFGVADNAEKANHFPASFITFTIDSAFLAIVYIRSVNSESWIARNYC